MHWRNCPVHMCFALINVYLKLNGQLSTTSALIHNPYLTLSPANSSVALIETPSMNNLSKSVCILYSGEQPMRCLAESLFNLLFAFIHWLKFKLDAIWESDCEVSNEDRLRPVAKHQSLTWKIDTEKHQSSTVRCIQWNQNHRETTSFQ